MRRVGHILIFERGGGRANLRLMVFGLNSNCGGGSFVGFLASYDSRCKSMRYHCIVTATILFLLVSALPLSFRRHRGTADYRESL